MARHELELNLYYDGAWNDTPVLTRNGCKIMRGVKTRGDSDPADAQLTIDNESEDYSPRSIASSLHGKIGQNTPARILVDGDVRIVGEAVSWKPGRPIKGSGWTSLQIAGVLQRIGRGRDPLAPPAQRSIIPLAPNAYYPLSDGNKSESATDLIGGTAMSLLGAPDMGKVAGPAAGDTLHPELVNSSGYIGGLLVPVPPATTGEWTVEFWFRAVAGAANARVVIAQWRTTGTYGAMSWVAYVQKTSGVHNVTVVAQHDLTSATGFQEVGGPFLDGRWHQVRVTARQDTATQIHVEFYIDDVLGDSTTASTWTVGNLTQLELGDYGGYLNLLYPFLDVESLSVANLARWTKDDPASTYEAGAGYPGETAADRFLRISAEEGITATVVGTAADSVEMGPQRSIPLLEQYDEIARTDDGNIFETRDSMGLTMRTGESKLNQDPAATLHYEGDIVPDLVPVYGDEGIRNDVTAASFNGSSRRVQQLTGPHNVQLPEDDPQGVGRYQTRIDVNPATDNALSDAAGWRVNLGTYNGTWYAEITADLDASPGMAAVVEALDIGDVIALTGLPVDEALDTVESIIVGISEDVPPARRTVTFYCVPAAPYRVGVLANTSGDTDPLLGRAETDGSTVSGGGASLMFSDDFESGVGSWSAFDSTFVSSTAQKRNGAKSGLMTVTGSPSQATVRTGNIAVTPGVMFSAELWVYSVAGYSSVYAVCDWYDAAFSYLGTTGGAPTALAAGVWERRVATVTPPVGAVWAQFGPTLGGTPPTGTAVYVDDAAVGGALVVATPSGPVWTTAADDFPLEIDVGGQVATIKDISGSTSPQVFRLDQTGSAPAYPILVGSQVTVQQPLILTL